MQLTVFIPYSNGIWAASDSDDKCDVFAGSLTYDSSPFFTNTLSDSDAVISWLFWSDLLTVLDFPHLYTGTAVNTYGAYLDVDDSSSTMTYELYMAKATLSATTATVVESEEYVTPTTSATENRRDCHTAGGFYLQAQLRKPGPGFQPRVTRVVGNGQSYVVQKEPSGESKTNVQQFRVALHPIVHLSRVVDKVFFMQELKRLPTRGKSMFPIARYKISNLL